MPPSSITAQLAGMFSFFLSCAGHECHCGQLLQNNTFLIPCIFTPFIKGVNRRILEFVDFVVLDTSFFFFNSQVSVLSFIVESDHTFLDYIKGG